MPLGKSMSFDEFQLLSRGGHLENRSFSIVADVAQKMEPDVLAPRAFLKRIFVSPDLQLIDSLHLLWTLHDSKRFWSPWTLNFLKSIKEFALI